VGTTLLAVVPAWGQHLCEDIAARLRTDPSFTRSGPQAMPLEALARQSFAEIATSSHRFDGKLSNDAYIASLAADYGMDRTLVAAIKKQTNFGIDEAWSLKMDGIHAFRDMQGTAHCSTYVFFRNGRVLADPPATMWGGMTEDPQNPIVECLSSDGALARIGGKTVFAVTDGEMPRSFDIGLRITAFENGAWGPACRVDAKFQTLYSARAVFRREDSPLSERTIKRVAPAIARARDHAGSMKTQFTFGTPLPEGERSRLKRLSDAHRAGVADNIPTFGAEIDREELSDIGNDRDDFPIMIDGKPYLVRIAHPSIGWRDFDGYRLIFFRAEGDTLEATASAIVDEHRGKLTAIKSAALDR
jgi:hypothetical protein